jgi:hypothetical protein
MDDEDPGNFLFRDEDILSLFKAWYRGGKGANGVLLCDQGVYEVAVI